MWNPTNRKIYVFNGLAYDSAGTVSVVDTNMWIFDYSTPYFTRFVWSRVNFLVDTWTWSTLALSPNPGNGSTNGRGLAATCHDGVNGRLLNFGGTGAPSGGNYADMWAFYYANNSWVQLSTTHCCLLSHWPFNCDRTAS